MTADPTAPSEPQPSSAPSDTPPTGPPDQAVVGIEAAVEAILAAGENELRLIHEFVQKEILRRSTTQT